MISVADGTCVIKYNANNEVPGTFDRAADVDLKKAASRIMSTCVQGPYTSGGEITGLGELEGIPVQNLLDAGICIRSYWLTVTTCRSIRPFVR